MNRVDVKEYFDLLEKTINENQLLGKSCHIFNMDESGFATQNDQNVSVLLQLGRKERPFQ